MLIEVRNIKLTKSRIDQMNYIGIPGVEPIEILGWVNMGKKKYVIIRKNGNYYRAEYLYKVAKTEQGTQFPSSDGGWEFPTLTHITCETHNRGTWVISPERNEEENLRRYEQLCKFRVNTNTVGQIYY